MQTRSIFSILLLLVISNMAQAQQIFTLSQFTQHNFIINPAAAGANDQASIGATYRKMWASMPGGPQTTLIFGDKYFAKNKVGLAVVLYDDKTGPTSRTGGQVNLSYSIQLEKEKRIMFGLGGKIIQYRINKTDFSQYIPNDPLLASSGTTIKADAAAGIYYKSPTLNIGFSVQQLVQSKLNFIKSTSNPEGKLYRHLYAMGSYNIRTDQDNVLVPNILCQFVPGLPADISGGMRLEHKDLLWVGFNYHHNQSYSAFAGLKIDHKFSIGYAFDQYSTPLSYFDDGSSAHEISLRYYFAK
ncbi:MAG: PorP/SprF family type IX secretion system membrane protein [Chitinophagaceae bacterium]|nr:PorP/SprF family type IX secretion system membrane protein [Chitinophagaceae bacterium]